MPRELKSRLKTTTTIHKGITQELKKFMGFIVTWFFRIFTPPLFRIKFDWIRDIFKQLPIALIILACLSSCALLTHPEESESAKSIPMASPISPARRVMQQITASWPGRQETLICVLELDSKHVAIAGLSNEGLSLFNLNYDGKSLTLNKSPLLPDSFSPELIIKDLQLVYWPQAELQKILPRYWRLEADSQHRRLYYHNELRVDVDYLQPHSLWAKEVKVTNHHYNYYLHIKTVNYESLPE
ncbi:DUF3261 domain-containing protein [Methylobacter psychrophilus]|uniref:DUF3261 domain-containing protein n=1 Tax=Methylobacter psychrophilus TaxID=96941 RepID=UPI0021D4DA5C|nr:DUF3261 domain-containing protein [Methylobacter psychrophilus]